LNQGVVELRRYQVFSNAVCGDRVTQEYKVPWPRRVSTLRGLPIALNLCQCGAPHVEFRSTHRLDGREYATLPGGTRSHGQASRYQD